jgi:tripartite-type tricarboxylate transporter receptor subunit TctC
MTVSFLTRRHLVRALGAAGVLAATGSAAVGQTDRPVRFILPVAAGSGVDALTRAASQALARSLGHPVVIENQPGAGGIIGTQALVKSAPDGYTLSVVSSNHVVYPSVLKSIPFDPLGDVTPITVIGSAPMVLAVNAKVPATNARELIALMKSKPDMINYASSGNGTLPHLAAAMFVDEAGVKARHIPYKGVGPMLTDLIGGQVDFCVVALGAIHPHLKSGALRAIGTASVQRSAGAPDIPTFREQGLPNYVVDAWFAVIGPKGMPPAEVMRIHSALVNAFAAPEVKDAMAKQGNTIALTTPAQAQAYFRSELAKYAALVRKAGVEPQ